jgi:capsular exopolysaccharide synthesis family protein
LEKLTGLPIVGQIPTGDAVSRDQIEMLINPQSRPSEEFRRLRANLRFVGVDSPNRVIMVTSAVPAEGKTSTACNLALALAAEGQSILLVDADLRRPKVHERFGLDSRVGLTSVLTNRVALDNATQNVRGVDVLTSGPQPPNPGELLSSRQMFSLIATAREYYSFIILDSAPIVSVSDSIGLAGHSDSALVVARRMHSRTDNISIAIAALRRTPTHAAGIVFTDALVSKRDRYDQYRVAPLN